MSESSRTIAYGVEAIAAVIEEPNLRRVNYLLARGMVPGASKMGNRWVLSIPAFRRAVHGEAA